MSDSNSEQSSKGWNVASPLRWVLGVGGTIVLGAIGSGVWERFGSRLWDRLARMIINGIDFVTKSYKDSIYQEASFGFQEMPSFMMFEVLLTIIPCAYIYLLLRHPKLTRNRSEGKSSKAKEFLASGRGFAFLSFVTVMVFVHTGITMSRARYVRAVTLYANSTIQRIAPSIDETEEEKLWATFRSVRCAEDYYALYDELQVHLKKAGLPNYGSRPL